MKFIAFSVTLLFALNSEAETRAEAINRRAAEANQDMSNGITELKKACEGHGEGIESYSKNGKTVYACENSKGDTVLIDSANPGVAIPVVGISSPASQPSAIDGKAATFQHAQRLLNDNSGTKPEVAAEEVKPEVVAEAVKPEVAAEAVKPEVAAEAVKPEVAAEAVKPEVAAEAVAPEKPIVSAAEMPPVIISEPLPDDECKSKLDEAIKELLQNDTKVLSLQTDITALKVANLTRKEKLRTLEDLVVKKREELKQLNDGTLEKLRLAYRVHGKIEQAEWVENKIKEITGSVDRKDDGYANASYFKTTKRLYGENTSAFLLAYSIKNPNSGLDENDLAMSWLLKHAQQIAASTFGNNSSQHNLLNLSTRVAHINGILGKGTEIKDLEKKMKSKQEQLAKIFLTCADKFKADHPACFETDIFKGTNECWENGQTVATNLGRVLAQITDQVRVNEKTQIQLGVAIKTQLSSVPAFEEFSE